MSLILALAVLASASSAAPYSDDYFECRLVRPAAAGEFTLASRLNQRGKPQYRSMSWNAHAAAGVTVLGSWAPIGAGGLSAEGRVSITTTVAPAERRNQPRIEIRGADGQVLFASGSLTPDRNGIVSFSMDWDGFVALGHRAPQLDIVVIGGSGQTLTQTQLAGEQIAQAEAGRTAAVTEFDDLVAHYRDRCHFSGDAR